MSRFARDIGNKYIIHNLLAPEILSLIRPLGSAPDLAVKNWTNSAVGHGIIRMPIRPALRQSPHQNFGTASYGIVRMTQPHILQQSKRKKSFKSSLNTSNSLSGGGGSNKRVMFSGVSDNESASESHDDITNNSQSNTLPILKVNTKSEIMYSAKI